MIELDAAPASAGAVDDAFTRGYRRGYALGFSRGVELAHELPRPETVDVRALPNHQVSGAASTLLLEEALP